MTNPLRLLLVNHQDPLSGNYFVRVVVPLSFDITHRLPHPRLTRVPYRQGDYVLRGGLALSRQLNSILIENP